MDYRRTVYNFERCNRITDISFTNTVGWKFISFNYYDIKQHRVTKISLETYDHKTDIWKAAYDFVTRVARYKTYTNYKKKVK